MKIKFLGTGSVLGVPVWNCNCKVCTSENKKDKRYRSSLFVEINGKNIVIDFGQDFRNQLIENKIKKIDYAFLTHAHRDHMTGVENLSTAENCSFMAPKDVLEDFYQCQGASRNWLTTRNKTLKIEEFKLLQVDNVKIDVVQLEHRKDYGVNVPCYGYVFSNNRVKIAYISDYNKIIEVDKLKDCDIIISDGNGIDNIGHGHVGINGSIDIYNELKPKKMILTHFKHDLSHEEMVAYTKQFGNIEIAYDGMEIEL